MNSPISSSPEGQLWWTVIVRRHVKGKGKKIQVGKEIDPGGLSRRLEVCQTGIWLGLAFHMWLFTYMCYDINANTEKFQLHSFAINFSTELNFRVVAYKYTFWFMISSSNLRKVFLGYILYIPFKKTVSTYRGCKHYSHNLRHTWILLVYYVYANGKSKGVKFKLTCFHSFLKNLTLKKLHRKFQNLSSEKRGSEITNKNTKLECKNKSSMCSKLWQCSHLHTHRCIRPPCVHQLHNLRKF